VNKNLHQPTDGKDIEHIEGQIYSNTEYLPLLTDPSSLLSQHSEAGLSRRFVVVQESFAAADCVQKTKLWVEVIVYKSSRQVVSLYIMELKSFP
jgi:hypothetical protein